MRVLHYTKSVNDGAGRAARALNDALRKAGVDSWIACLDDPKGYSHAIQIRERKPANGQLLQDMMALSRQQLEQAGRTSVSNTLFSGDFVGCDVASTKFLERFDIHHLHWVVDFIHPYSVQNLMAKDLPVVWTLHDTWPLTGGCHYTAGCRLFESDCVDCPQLLDDSRQLPLILQRQKRMCLNQPRLTVTAPSKWLSREAASSSIFRSAKHRSIPNCVATDVFTPATPEEKAARRADYGINPYDVVALVIAQDIREQRKGYGVLAEGLAIAARRNADLSQLTILAIGHNGEDLQSMGVRVIPIGTVFGNAKIRDAIIASDFLIQPALEENYSNVILETLSCGVPALVSSAGGNGEIIETGVNGWTYDVARGAPAFAEALSKALEPGAADGMTAACRNVAKQRSPDIIAAEFKALYEECIAAHGHRAEVRQDEAVQRSLSINLMNDRQIAERPKTAAERVDAFTVRGYFRDLIRECKHHHRNGLDSAPGRSLASVEAVDALRASYAADRQRGATFASSNASLYRRIVLSYGDSLFRLERDHKLQFGFGQPAMQMLVYGGSATQYERDYLWTEAPTATFAFKVPDAKAGKLRFDLEPFRVYGVVDEQPATIHVNGHISNAVIGEHDRQIAVDLPSEAQGIYVVGLELPNAYCPRNLGADEERELALRIYGIEIGD